MPRQMFATAQAARDYLAEFGFPPFKKGLTSGRFQIPGYIARLSMGIVGKTGQCSTGAGWGYLVVVERADAAAQ